VRAVRQKPNIMGSGLRSNGFQNPKSKFQNRIARLLACGLAGLGVFLVLSSVATPALAHDNLGGDEMSMAIAIFIAGVVTISGAAFALLWAARCGQFNDVESAKYAMLANADDLDSLPGAPAPSPEPRPAPAPAPTRLQGGQHAAK
jgi:cbb3-type cytochrome oxidase maturation protein